MVMKDLSMRTLATRDIEIGEEITISCKSCSPSNLMQ